MSAVSLDFPCVHNLALDTTTTWLYANEGSYNLEVAMPRVNVDIPDGLKGRVDRLRAVQKRSLRAVVEIALERYLADEEPKAKKAHAA